MTRPFTHHPEDMTGLHGTAAHQVAALLCEVDIASNDRAVMSGNSEAGRRTANAALSTGNPDVFRWFLRRHGKTPYLDHWSRGAFDIRAMLKAGELDFLVEMHEMGFDMTSQSFDIMRVAYREGRTDIVDFAVTRLGAEDVILRHLSLVDAIRTIPPVYAAKLADEILALDKGSHDSWRIVSSPKTFSVRLFLGLDVGHQWADTQPHVQRLAELAASNHGRLILRRMEPSLTDILRRAENESFYGMPAGSNLPG